VRLSPDERERVFLAVADERRSIAALIDGLDPQQLATGSLCVGWDVKTVAAHLISDFTDGFSGFLASGIRHGSINRGIDALARCRACAPAAEIAETLRLEADHQQTGCVQIAGGRSGYSRPATKLAACAVIPFATYEP
jgi:hypothetical protein